MRNDFNVKAIPICWLTVNIGKLQDILKIRKQKNENKRSLQSKSLFLENAWNFSNYSAFSQKAFQLRNQRIWSSFPRIHYTAAQAWKSLSDPIPPRQFLSGRFQLALTALIPMNISHTFPRQSLVVHLMLISFFVLSNFYAVTYNNSNMYSRKKKWIKFFLCDLNSPCSPEFARSRCLLSFLFLFYDKNIEAAFHKIL